MVPSSFAFGYHMVGKGVALRRSRKMRGSQLAAWMADAYLLGPNTVSLTAYDRLALIPPVTSPR